MTGDNRGVPRILSQAEQDALRQANIQTVFQLRLHVSTELLAAMMQRLIFMDATTLVTQWFDDDKPNPKLIDDAVQMGDALLARLGMQIQEHRPEPDQPKAKEEP